MSEQNTAHGDPMPDRPHPLEGALEPDSRYHAAAHDHALTSIAISLKRIADHLDQIAPTLSHGALTNIAYDMGCNLGLGFERGRKS